MPASLQPSPGIALKKSVLLIEEYDALAVAIGSALKKFAPAYEAHLARSLGEAETQAFHTPPSLFVMDFDPPHAGEIAFLSRIKLVHPDARALVIAAADTREIAAEIGLAGALHFIEKPFELAEFGAAVQALLGPWAATGVSKPRGTLRDLGLLDLLQLECVSNATKVIGVEEVGGRAGEIHIQDGQICHAMAMESFGLEALEEMLQWRAAHFAETKMRADTPKTISSPWKVVLLEVLRKTKEAGKPIALGERQKPKTEAKPAKTGKKIVVIDDTEMLLIFVEDVLSTADQEWEIITASTGAEGQRQIEEKSPNLVLLDYCLPDIKGDELCSRLLANEKTSQIPIVMMSGHVLEMNAASERYENIVATIAKPFLSETLIDLVQKMLSAGKVRVRKKTLPPKPDPLASAPSPVPDSEPKRSENGKTFKIPLPPILPPPPRIEPPKPPAVASTSRAMSTAIPAEIHNEIVLGLPLAVMSMQFTPLLKIASVRAMPSALAVSLRIPSDRVPGPLTLEAGFELGPVQLDAKGRIDIVRLLPTPHPTLLAASPSFDMRAVDVGSGSARVDVTPTISGPMTIQLLAHFRLLGVELSPDLEIAALLAKAHHGPVRVTLGPQPAVREENTAPFDYVSVKLDASARITELSLIPLD